MVVKQEEQVNVRGDVKQYLAQIGCAASDGQVDTEADVSADDPRVLEVLTPHVKAIFAEHGGRVGEDD